MNRAKYKEKAKNKVKGNKWYLWKPLVMFNLTFFVFTFLISLMIVVPMVICDVAESDITFVIGLLGNGLSSVVALIETIFMFGYAKYCMNFVRGNEQDWKDPIKFVMSHFFTALLVSLIVDIMVACGTILLIIPGIIIAIGHVYIQEVYVDNSDLKPMEIVKKSWALTKGHKKDLFVLGLSFIGWILLTALTAGILIIWVMPYMNVTFLYVYEDLLKKQNN
jgi:uncharacterized membrane protein